LGHRLLPPDLIREEPVQCLFRGDPLPADFARWEAAGFQKVVDSPRGFPDCPCDVFDTPKNRGIDFGCFSHFFAAPTLM